MELRRVLLVSEKSDAQHPQLLKRQARASGGRKAQKYQFSMVVEQGQKKKLSPGERQQKGR
ncbi:hypothetical protein [Photobacterium alginatilyticum]|uniref:Ribosome alternative rescue factor ArfA n=1 Tax=Photobacterium alginatilyticum TaxID=1775171 RepID=A0ABW9YI06_9GAMM|nr:hypothetical protein [Photobacterium alginatilyticum]NBI53452.1 hypothetical protein [Photobacterium alginatilyticum]